MSGKMKISIVAFVFVLCKIFQTTGKMINRNSHEQIEKQKINPRILSINLNNGHSYRSNLSVKDIQRITLEIFAFETYFTIAMDQSHRNRCHFNGFINDASDVQGEFDMCNGMDGVFQWSNKLYFIKPTGLSKLYPGFLKPGTQLFPHEIYTENINVRNPLFSCKLLKTKKRKHIPEKRTPTSVPRRRQKRNAQSSYPMVDIEFVNETIIELLIVVTKSFRKKFKTDLHQYILNNVAISTKLLRHRTINASISIEIVDIIHLDEEFEKSNKMHDWSMISQEHVVDRFCHWLQKKKKKWNFTWDSAILINDGFFSSYAIGIAHLRSMCSENNCLAVVDRGFGTGFIIAHELAHQMNARHDFDKAEACKIDENEEAVKAIKYKTFMSTSLYFDHYPFVWSKCSQRLIKFFLKSKYSMCLNEINKSPNLYSHKKIFEHVQNYSTGLIYDLDQQCSFALGERARSCKKNNLTKCSALYCKVEGYEICIRADAVIADGTKCGEEKYCVHGKCVDKNAKHPAIDGGWSNYSEWSQCSRLCDGGVQFSERLCNTPEPDRAGLFCVGPKERIRSCNLKTCDNQSDPRKELCQKYGLEPYLPQIDEEFACRLVCITSDNTDNSLIQNTTLPDGTPCSPLNSDICVRGACYKTGCDRVVGSRKAFDQCHVCDGKNDTCEKRVGYFNGSKHAKVNMIVAFTVPAGVSNIFISKISQREYPYTEEVFDDFELLLVINKTTVIRRSKTIEPFAEGTLYYSGSSDPIETIEIRGKIQTEIVVMIKLENPDTVLNLPSIEYWYYKPKLYRWGFQKINAFSCPFCTGYLQINPTCLTDNDILLVSDKYCPKYNRPEAQIRSCRPLCGYRWEKPDENHVNSKKTNSCPVPCGIGYIEIPYFCQWKNMTNSNNISWKNVNDTKCISVGLEKRPHQSYQCEGQCNPLMWSYGSWEPCPVECGSSFKYRSYVCRDTKDRVWSREHCESDLGSPIDKTACLSFIGCKTVSQWVTTYWSKCSKTCGGGTQKRNVYCFRKEKDMKLEGFVDENFLKYHEQISDVFCESHSSKPAVEMPCLLKSCLQWTPGVIGKCSVTCGKGILVQSHVCVENENDNSKVVVVDENLCIKHNLPKPEISIKTCFLAKCPVQFSWVTTDWRKCSVYRGKRVRKRKLKCSYKIGNGTLKLWSDNKPCSNLSLPATLEICKEISSPIWRYGSWSKCEGTCLYGTQVRTASCTDQKSHKILSNSFCNITKRRRSVRKCLLSRLCGYWKIGKWSECSVSCGLGMRSRAVVCHYENGTKSNDGTICRNIAPFEEIHCQNTACPSKGFWWLIKASECYGFSCDPGILYANVKCVNQNFAELDDSLCSGDKHPNYYAGCINKNCRQYFWRVESWDNIPCSQTSCMMSVRNRNVECINDYGKTFPDHLCDGSIKPISWRLCPSPRECSDVPRSCKELKEKHPGSNDGEYSLSIDLNWTYYIYCADMKTDSPKEYLRLKEINFSRSSKFTSVKSPQCVYSEEIEVDQTCPECQMDESLSSITYYNMVRLNLTDLSVDVMDNRFSITNGPLFIPYGTAKDCTGSISCPKGHFRIDLRGTGFSVSMSTTWNELYHKSAYRIVRSQSSQIVKGWCGGKCSGCSPVNRLHIEPHIYGQDYEVRSNEIS